MGELVLDLQAHEVRKAGQLIKLTRLEFRILYRLAMNAGRVVPYSQLVEYAWGYYEESNPTLLKTHVMRIRQKLGLSTGKEGLRAVVGVGYSLAS